MAKGDYTQTVSYLGEFSKAFNTMTAQRKEREKACKFHNFTPRSGRSAT